MIRILHQAAYALDLLITILQKSSDEVNADWALQTPASLHAATSVACSFRERDHGNYILGSPIV